MNNSYHNSALVKINDLSRRPSGILVKDERNEFGYSDGEKSEQYLTEILSNASDLSSISPELEGKVVDWPSEYHLSAKRANLLRALDLPSGARVLELGSGCGAISRYLGEQGFQVDAIEGSSARAEIAALRCRDLENVNIVCSNFNQLQLPEETYDLVVFIGVVEYAARFWPESTSSEQAVVELLSAARKSLTERGSVIVAIENRTGMKYVFGAHEDHYSKRYIGVHNYPENIGIKTYTRHEWTDLIDRAGYTAHKFLFPFPDYKVPTVILSEQYCLRSKQAYAHIEGVRSRDYLMLLDLAEYEPMFWEASSANGTLPEFSNSFLILLGRDAGDLQRIAQDDFVHLPDFKRKNQYSVVTRMRADSGLVERRGILQSPAHPGSGLVHHIQDEPFIEGDLLSIVWCRSLLIDPWAAQFKDLLGKYYQFLGVSPLNIDLVPTNIIVDVNGDYQYFDSEWEVAWDLDRDYVFFRAMLLFAQRHAPSLRDFCRWYSLYTIDDFVSFCFEKVKQGVPGPIHDYADVEERFQSLVNKELSKSSVNEILSSRLNQLGMVWPISMKVYWKRAQEPYSEANAVTIQRFSDEESVRFLFRLPDEVENITHIRFDPCDEKSTQDIGFLNIPCVDVQARVNGARTELLRAETDGQVAAMGNLSGIVFNEDCYGEVFAVVGDNPEIEFALPPAPAGEKVDQYRVEIECSHSRSVEYRLVRDRFLVQEELLKRHMRVQKGQYDRLKDELDTIKSSKLWRMAERYRAIRNKLGV